MGAKFFLLAEIDEETIDSAEEIECFRDFVLTGFGDLRLHSDTTGDFLNGGNPVKVHLAIAEPDICPRCGGDGIIGDAEPCDACCGTGVKNLCNVTDAMFGMQ